MNKTYLKNILRLIQQSKGRFFSLLAIVAIGVAFFVGVAGTSPIMGYSVDAYNDRQNLKDFTIYSNVGFDKDDIKAIQKIKGIKTVEGSYFADVLAQSGKKTYVTRLHAYNQNQSINQFVLKEGRLPKNNKEALAECGTELENGFRLGDTVRFSNDGIKVDSVKIVGLVDTPLYLNQTKENSTLSNQAIRTYLYLPTDAFSTKVYTEVNILTTKGQDYYCFSDDYKDYIKKVKKRIQKVASIQTKKKTNQIKEGLEQANQMEADLQSGLEQLETSEDELNTKEVQINEQFYKEKNRLNEGWNEIVRNEKVYHQTLQSFSKQKEQVNSYYDEIVSAENQITNSINELKNLNEQIEGLQKYRDGLSLKLDEYQSLLDSISCSDTTLLKDCPDLFEYGSSYGLNEENSVLDLKNCIRSSIEQCKQEIENCESQKEQVNQQLKDKGIQDLNGSLAKLEAQYNELKAQKLVMEEKKNQINQGQALLDASAKQLTLAKQEWLEGNEIYESSLKTSQDYLESSKDYLEAKKEEIEKGLEEVKDSQKNLKAYSKVKWTILDRQSHYASVTYEATVDQMKAIGRIFPLFFILVAALVCMTTMKRMVDEQRNEIGTLRALGYTQRQCCAKYLIYAGIATVLGEVLGTIIGLITFPPIIYNTWKMMYILPSMQMRIPVSLIASSSITFMIGMLLTSYLSCRNDMKEYPSQLMRPKALKLGKNTIIERLPFLWKRLSFNTKVTVRNIVRYKKRFILTVIGVAGCSALLVTGFGIRDSIKDIVQLHFYEILKYDGYAQIEDGTASQELLNQMKENKSVKRANLIYMYNGEVSASKQKESVNIQIFEKKEDVFPWIHLRNRKDKKRIRLSDDGIVLSEKCAENLNLSVGDFLKVQGEDGTYKKIPITGINEMYIHHSVFMTKACYIKYFGTNPKEQSILIDLKGSKKDKEAFQKELANYANVSGITFYDTTLQNFNHMVEGLDVIVWALIISSMLLAFVVLSNLIQVNISERQREIATLKVLGFRKKEVRGYIFKENNVLVFLGALCGMPIGCILHHFIMRMVEMDYVMFGRTISIPSYLYALCLTLLFGLCVEFFMRKKLQRIQMVDSLKSVE